MVLSQKRKLETTSPDIDSEEAETVESSDRSNRPAKALKTGDTRRLSLSPPKLARLRKPILDQQHSNDIPRPPRRIESPIRLTKVDGLPEAVNVDTVGLEDILSSPLIKQCWAFNYLIDVDFLL